MRLIGIDLQSYSFNSGRVAVRFQQLHGPFVIDNKRYQTEGKAFQNSIRNKDPFIFGWLENGQVRIEYSRIEGTLEANTSQHVLNLPADFFRKSMQSDPDLGVSIFIQVSSYS